MAAVVAGALVIACRVEGTPPVAHIDTDLVGCGYHYSLEVANDASASVRVRIAFNAGFDVPDADNDATYIDEHVIVLESGERRTYPMGICGAHLPDPNVLVRWFGRIHFYNEGSGDPFRSYYYPISRWEDSDAQYVYQSSDGTWERLFVESPDRPFYLERDDDNAELARIVISFVPNAEAGAELR